MRPIDADELLEQVNSLEQLARKRVYDTPTNSPAYERYITQYQEREEMLAILKAHPTADVVPREEFEDLQRRYDLAVAEREANAKALIEANIDLDAMRGAANSLKMHYENAKQETAREIFEEIEKLVVSRKLKNGLFGDLLESDIAELKKKYTEDSTDGKRTDR